MCPRILSLEEPKEGPSEKKEENVVYRLLAPIVQRVMNLDEKKIITSPFSMISY